MNIHLGWKDPSFCVSIFYKPKALYPKNHIDKRKKFGVFTKNLYKLERPFAWSRTLHFWLASEIAKRTEKALE